MNRITQTVRTGLTAGAIGAIALTALAPVQADARESIRWATSSTGSYGYMVASAMANVLESAMPGQVVVTVNPYPSTTAAKRATMEGEAEIGYTADVGMRDLYDGVGAFDGYNPRVGKQVHTWYAYPMETFMTVATDRADEFNCVSDLSGRPVFHTPAGFMNWLNFRRIQAALGNEFNHVEIDTATQADALAARSIDGAVAYTTAGRSLPAYWRETELRADVTVINPCPDEIETLTAAGLVPMEVDPTQAFSQDVGVDTVLGVPIYFAYNVRADMDADLVYNMISAFYDAREQLAEQDPGFGPLAEDFIGMQTGGIGGNPDIPVHAGLARFLQEHGAWNDDWTIAGD